jgi:cysteine desulfurase
MAHGNPASQHTLGRRARQTLEAAREACGTLLGCDFRGREPDRLIFTSGGTEANNLALFGLAGDPPGRIIVSAIEHPSVREAAAELARRGWRIDSLGVDQQGVARVEQLAEWLATEPRPRLVSIMLANNETGVIQPVAELAALCRAHGVLFHTDAVQAAGKLPLDFRALGVDLLTVAAHKFHGPRGIGALITRHKVPLVPRLFGGFQQGGLRPGTELTALAVGMECALRACVENLPARSERMRALRTRFEAALQAECAGVQVHAAAAPRLPQTVSASFAGLDRQAVVMALDMAGVCCSTGSACASGSSEPSHVLRAMGLTEEQVQSSVRFSFSAMTTATELDTAAEKIREVALRLRALNSRTETC